MMMEKDFGFIELDHTADWALKVWAPNLEGLFEQAARGMAWLVQMTLREGPRITRTVEVEGVDVESLLVAFLSELLYLTESEGIGFDHYQLKIQDFWLLAVLEGAPVREQKKEIKAVTYHNLEVRHTDQGYTVTVVFDV
jgi:SHS2 domain-containing protein